MAGKTQLDFIIAMILISIKSPSNSDSEPAHTLAGPSLREMQ